MECDVAFWRGAPQTVAGAVTIAIEAPSEPEPTTPKAMWR